MINSLKKFCGAANIFGWLMSEDGKNSRGGKTHFARLSVEGLETRLTPATLHWRGAAPSGLVSDSTNWVESRVPTAQDWLVFDGNDGPTSNHPAVFDIPVVDRIETQPSYTGELKFNANFTATSSLSIINTPITIAEGATLDSAFISLAGEQQTVRVGGGGRLGLPAGATGQFIGPSGVAFVGTQPGPGPGPILVTLTAKLLVGPGATLEIAANTLFGNQTDANLGTINWTSGTITTLAGEVFNNQGTVNTSASASWSGAGIFNNSGVVRNIGAGNTALFAVTFNDIVVPGSATPEVKADSGTLAFGTGSSSEHTAKYTAANGARISFRGLALGQDYTLRSGTTFNGTGTVEILAMARVVIPYLETVESAVGSNVLLSGLGATIKGGNFISRGNVRWESGEIKGTWWDPYGLVEIGGNSDTTLTTMTLMLRGPSTWLNGLGNLVLDRSDIRNFGTFEIQNDRSMIDEKPDVQPSSFKNEVAQWGTGSLVKTAGMENRIEVRFINEGSLLLNGRSIMFTRTVVQESGRTELGGGTLTVNGDFRVLGGVFSGIGTLNANLEVGLAEVNMGSAIGTLQINGNYTHTLSNSKLRVRYDKANGTFDRLNVSGLVDLKGVLQLDLPSGQPDQDTEWDAISSDNPINGTFDTTPAGFTTSYPCGVVHLKKN